MIQGLSDTTLFVGGLCSVYETAACTQAGIDRIDLATRQVTLAVDLSASPHKGNGPMVWGGGGRYFAMAATPDSKGGVGEAYVVKIDLDNRGTVDKVHSFAAGDAGCCGLFADPKSGRLYVGDTTPAGGQFSVYDPGVVAPAIVTLAGNPYTGALVAK